MFRYANYVSGRKEKELEKAKQRAAMAAKLRAINYERQGMGLPLLTRLPKEDEPESEPEDASQPQNKPVEKKKTPEPVTTDRAEDSTSSPPFPRFTPTNTQPRLLPLPRPIVLPHPSPKSRLLLTTKTHRNLPHLPTTPQAEATRHRPGTPHY